MTKPKEIKSTMALDTTFCPKCGKVGQRKYRRRYHQVYEEFDHYGIKSYSKLHHNYKSTCYIGNIETLNNPIIIPLVVKSK